MPIRKFETFIFELRSSEINIDTILKYFSTHKNAEVRSRTADIRLKVNELGRELDQPGRCHLLCNELELHAETEHLIWIIQILGKSFPELAECLFKTIIDVVSNPAMSDDDDNGCGEIAFMNKHLDHYYQTCEIIRNFSLKHNLKKAAAAHLSALEQLWLPFHDLKSSVRIADALSALNDLYGQLGGTITRADYDRLSRLQYSDTTQAFCDMARNKPKLWPLLVKYLKESQPLSGAALENDILRSCFNRKMREEFANSSIILNQIFLPMLQTSQQDDGKTEPNFVSFLNRQHELRNKGIRQKDDNNRDFADEIDIGPCEGTLFLNHHDEGTSTVPEVAHLRRCVLFQKQFIVYCRCFHPLSQDYQRKTRLWLHCFTNKSITPENFIYTKDHKMLGVLVCENARIPDAMKERFSDDLLFNFHELAQGPAGLDEAMNVLNEKIQYATQKVFKPRQPRMPPPPPARSLSKIINFNRPLVLENPRRASMD